MQNPSELHIGCFGTALQHKKLKCIFLAF